MKTFLFFILFSFVVKSKAQEFKLANKNKIDFLSYSKSQPNLFASTNILNNAINFERRPIIFDLKRAKKIRISGFTFVGISIASVVSAITISRINFKNQNGLDEIPFPAGAGLLGGFGFYFAVISFPLMGIGVHRVHKIKEKTEVAL